MTRPAQPFARNGTEKMVYDVRMSPQAVWHVWSRRNARSARLAAVGARI